MRAVDAARRLLGPEAAAAQRRLGAGEPDDGKDRDANMNAVSEHESAQLTPAEPDASPRTSSLRDEAKWYLNQALDFEKSKQASQQRQTAIAWRVAIGAGVIAIISIIGASALVQLKRPNPPVVLRNNTVTGVVDVLDVTRDGLVPFGEVEDRADLRRYVERRESYDWETIQSTFDAVKLMTADKERDQYVAFYGLPNAPQKVLKDQFRIIAQAGAITFVGSTAQVFFSRKLIPLGASGGGMQPKTEYWVATIAYRHDNLPEKKSELEINPTGFRVTSYTVDRDWTRAPDPAQAGTAAPQPAVPSAAPDQPATPATVGSQP
jgi:type IV secretion system protein VirB8